VGPAPDVDNIEEDFALLRRNARAASDQTSGKPIASHRGLYLNIGHGSNGLASTPLCAEFLASLAAGEPSPLSRRERDILEPARFILRAMKKQRA
jgi:tRNA 5-methylaminomethyl-2-thiouridine biosynthesis bifunctional protein